MNDINNEHLRSGAYKPDPAELVDLHGEMIYKIALLQTRNPHDAEDVLQEVFLRMMKYKDTFVSSEHAKAWLIRVTQTCSLKLVGSAWNKKTTGLPEAGEVFVTKDMNHDEIDLYNALAELPEDIRIAIHLYYLMGYSVKEVSDTLGIASGSVKTRLYRGRNILRDILGRDI